MSSNSNNQGRAYEYITLLTLYREIGKIRKSQIVINSSFNAAQKAWNYMSASMKNILSTSAASFVPTIFELEPLILEDDGDVVELSLQKDGEGEKGDVRDVLIVRNGIHWEIGLSMKHNHFAVKHNRLSPNIDFGEKWYGYPCSQRYWDTVNPVFDYLQKEKSFGRKWSQLADKSSDIYIPILNAFIQELNLSYKKHPNLPRKMVEYLLGEYDFYKVISIDNSRNTQINAFNLHGTLNRGGRTSKPRKQVPVSLLPTRIVNVDFKPNSSNTIELYLDRGWQFSFRIHNASTLVETSLKFDIQIIGMPATIITIDCKWE